MDYEPLIEQKTCLDLQTGDSFKKKKNTQLTTKNLQVDGRYMAMKVRGTQKGEHYFRIWAGIRELLM